jgi:hypothetical protein
MRSRPSKTPSSGSAGLGAAGRSGSQVVDDNARLGVFFAALRQTVGEIAVMADKAAKLSAAALKAATLGSSGPCRRVARGRRASLRRLNCARPRSPCGMWRAPGSGQRTGVCAIISPAGAGENPTQSWPSSLVHRFAPVRFPRSGLGEHLMSHRAVNAARLARDAARKAYKAYRAAPTRAARIDLYRAVAAWERELGLWRKWLTKSRQREETLH